MINSMTGYATHTQTTPYGTLNLELRAVNNRYLDVQLRLPDDFRPLEPGIREVITQKLHRGKVECRLNFTPLDSIDDPRQLNHVLLHKLLELDHTVRSVLPEAQSLSVDSILNWPGMLGNTTLPVDELREYAMTLLRATLEDFQTTRNREGEKLKGILLERLNLIRQQLDLAAPRIPVLITAFEEKLKTRVREALDTLDEDRIRQEIIFFASKIDIDEELSRLQTHLDEVEHVLSKGGAVGKRLDFLMQELNREANTIGSKSVDIVISKMSMTLKVLIEQMREQVQNIE
ncbi:MAG: YicC family protein [Nitrosomonas sp.]|nr:YicC family protein [Nitrosomonas sp.]